MLEGVGQAVVPPLYKEQAREAANKNLTFGIRPEHLEDRSLLPEEARNDSVLNATVDVVENLGSELLVYLETNGKSLQARLNPRSNSRTGNPASLQVDLEYIHLFDSDTQQAIF